MSLARAVFLAGDTLPPPAVGPDILINAAISNGFHGAG